MITKRQLLLLLIVVVALICTAIGTLIYRSIQNEASYTVTEKTETSKEDATLVVEYNDQTDLLTSDQKRKLPDTLTTKTSANIPDDDTQLRGVIREGSIDKQGSETFFIIDIEKLQTSYLVNRFTDPAESLDIVNVLCVPVDKKIYEPDNCREE